MSAFIPVFEYQGIRVSVKPELEIYSEKVRQCKKLIDWIDNINRDEIHISSITILSVFMFGPNIGFLTLQSDAGTIKGDKIIPIPNFVFLRGDSVAVLLFITVQETGERYLLLCNQPRLPFGGYMTELCAGMIDNETVSGAIFKEIHEETGIIIEKSELHELGSYFMSAGACDEKITFFEYNKVISASYFEIMKTKIYGENESEQITLRFYTEEDIVIEIKNNSIKDAKLLCALTLYSNKHCKI
jgi:8-oxo-dGTP pyrophosphatase MutT (NUDIX family)